MSGRAASFQLPLTECCRGTKKPGGSGKAQGLCRVAGLSQTRLLSTFSLLQNRPTHRPVLPFCRFNPRFLPLPETPRAALLSLGRERWSQTMGTHHPATSWVGAELCSSSLDISSPPSSHSTAAPSPQHLATSSSSRDHVPAILVITNSPDPLTPSCLAMHESSGGSQAPGTVPRARSTGLTSQLCPGS